MATVPEAFRQARIHAYRHMTACEQADLRWGEVAITEIVTAHAAKAVDVYPFTQQEESRVGADWMWWWLDGSVAYGMLVQAKRVKFNRRGWRFDFNYKSKNASFTQRRMLFQTAAHFNLVPAYALYLGSGDARGWATCSDIHASGRCLECVKRSVSLAPALLANTATIYDSISTYGNSVALENLLSPSAQSRARSLPGPMSQSLAKFLTSEQAGTSAVVRAMFDLVLKVRQASFATLPASSLLDVPTGLHDQLGRVFNQFPDDTGHWGLNYFEHLLAPLLHTPPTYVLDAMNGQMDDGFMAGLLEANIAGMVVIHSSRLDLPASP